MNQADVRSAPVWVRLAANVVKKLPAGRYRAIHRLTRRPPPPFLMRMSAELGGAAYRCDLRDAIAREVCFTGVYEPQETALVRSLLHPGATFVDVGANWGYFSLMAAHLVGAGGRVLSLEPDPRLFPILRENVERNGVRQATLLQVAAADEAGELTLAGFDESGGNFGVSRIVAGPAAGARSFRVRASPLDQLLEEQGIERVDLLKMDIEGAEAAALAGLEGSLRARRVARLLLELHPAELREQGSSSEQVVERLRGAGYAGYTIDHAPGITRSVAYGKTRGPGDFLRPLAPGEPLDAWPHQIWCAPGVGPG